MNAINKVSMNSTIPSIAAKTAAASSMESKNLEKQLQNEQQSLNRLSSDSQMTAKEKEKERREIQLEIAELNRKIRQERMEEEAEVREAAQKQEKKKIIREEMLEKTDSEDKTDSTDISETAASEKQTDKSVDAGLPLVNIKNVLTASSRIEQNTVQNHVSGQIENQKNILEAEIKSDTLYGTDTTAKEETLSKLYRKEALQIEVLNQQPDQVTPNMNFGSKIIIRE